MKYSMASETPHEKQFFLSSERTTKYFEFVSRSFSTLEVKQSSAFFGSLVVANNNLISKSLKTCRNVRKNSTTKQSEDYFKLFFLPDIVQPNNYVHNSKINPKSSRKRNTTKEIDIRKNKKQTIAKAKFQSSYRLLTEPTPLENFIPSHFIFNHTHKILMFGRACAVMKASDDEGVDTRYGNPIFNQDLLNLKFDEISEIDVKSNAAISKSIKMHFNEHKMQLKNASPMRQKLIDSRCKYLSALQITNESYTEVPIPSGFSFSYSLSEPPINYIDFHIILALISNIENISQSLRIGDEIKIALNSFQQLLECALDFTSKFGFICGENDLLFMCVTHRIARTLYEVLNINNIKFMIFTKFFKEKKVFLEEIFDEVAITLATQIDNGGVFAKELLHYRELACVLEMNAFASMVQMECEMIYNDGKYVKKHLMRAARAYLPFGDLYEVKFVFDEKGNFVIESKEINDVIEEKPLFPVFNMFGGFTTDENGFLSGVTW